MHNDTPCFDPATCTTPSHHRHQPVEDDQVITILAGPYGTHTAIGSPSIIARALRAGQQIICQRRVGEGGDPEYVLRLTPNTPFALTYPEAVDALS